MAEVGPDEGVEVDRAPLLELGHLHVGEPEQSAGLAGREPEEGPEGPQGVDGGAAPELGHAGVEEHGALVVVAVGTEGLADGTVRAGVSQPTDERPAVPAAGPGRMARAVRPPPVDRTEARGCQGQQHGRMVTDGLRYVLAATESRGHQGEGVAPVEGGTGWTDRLASGAARLQQHPVGQARGVEADLREPGGPDRGDSPRQPDRAPAAPCGPDLGGERLDTSRTVQPGEDAVDDPASGKWDRTGGSGSDRAGGSHGPDGGGGGVT